MAEAPAFVQHAARIPMQALPLTRPEQLPRSSYHHTDSEHVRLHALRAIRPLKGEQEVLQTLGLCGAVGILGTSFVTHRALTSRSRRRRTKVPRRVTETLLNQVQGAVSSSGTKKSAVIVGGGIGALATAAQLAQGGMSVTIYEKNPEVGGRCQTVESKTVDGYRWDTGPSLFLLPQKYQDAFRRLGTDIKDQLNLKRVDPCYRVVFGDETSIDVDYDPLKMTAQMEKFEPGCTSNYYRFLSCARRMLDMGVDRFVDRQFESWPELVDLPELVPQMLMKGWATLPLVNMLLGIDDLMKTFFQDARLRALFTFQTLYVGLTPYNSPGALCLLAGTDLTDGVWYPCGGWRNVTNSMASLAKEAGVNIVTNAGVDEVLSQDGKAIGIKLQSGQTVNADVVVVNADLPTAYRTLLRNTDQKLKEDSMASTQIGGSISQTGTPCQNAYEDIAGREYSCGVIAFYWAVNRKVDYLLHHSIFLASPVDEAKAWKPITSVEMMAGKPNFYVHCPKRTDPTAAPPHGDSIMVLFPVGNLQDMAKKGKKPTGVKGELYADIKAAARKTILQRFADSGAGDIEADIVEEFVRDPETIGELYGLEHGATFGLSHGLLPSQGGLAMTRPPPRSAELENLFFVGAGTRPGNGVPLVLMGAGLTSKQILEDQGVNVGQSSSVGSDARAKVLH